MIPNPRIRNIAIASSRQPSGRFSPDLEDHGAAHQKKSVQNPPFSD
jgi:hypothetical protein